MTYLHRSNDKPPEPENKLQGWAMKKSLYTSTQFAKAMEAAGIMSYGLANKKWHTGRAGNTQYNTLTATVRWLGASTIEEVFDP